MTYTTTYRVDRKLLDSLSEDDLRWLEKEVSARLEVEMERQLELAIRFGFYG